MMNPKDPDAPAPTVADDVSAAVDDAEVIAKTLPLTRPRERALNATRGYVAKHPIPAVLIAAAGGAVLSILAIGCRRHDSL